MSLEEILSTDSGRKRIIRVGRGAGSGRGKTCGRGHKGAGSRSGGKDQHPLYEGGQVPLWMRLPKRGFSNYAFRVKYRAVQLAEASKRIDGDITNEAIVAAGLASKNDNIKLVAGEGVSVAANVTVNKVTASVRAAIEAAGKTLTEVPVKRPVETEEAK